MPCLFRSPSRSPYSFLSPSLPQSLSPPYRAAAERCRITGRLADFSVLTANVKEPLGNGAEHGKGRSYFVFLSLTEKKKERKEQHRVTVSYIRNDGLLTLIADI